MTATASARQKQKGSEMTTGESRLAVPESQAPVPVTVLEFSVDEVVAQRKKVTDLMERVMVKGEHYGVIPGTKKPTLLKPGAELLCFMFRLDPEYDTTETHLPGEHLTIKSVCRLWHIPTGQRIASGEGSATTLETKHRWRQAERKCPECQAPAIIKGRQEYGGGFICYARKGGCGAKFSDDAPEIVKQPLGRVPNENPSDQHNTVLKMGNKRALVAAVLNATAASDIFTQDLEDVVEAEVDAAPTADGALPTPPASRPASVRAAPPARPAPTAREAATTAAATVQPPAPRPRMPAHDAPPAELGPNQKKFRELARQRFTQWGEVVAWSRNTLKDLMAKAVTDWTESEWERLTVLFEIEREEATKKDEDEQARQIVAAGDGTQGELVAVDDADQGEYRRV